MQDDNKEFDTDKQEEKPDGAKIVSAAIVGLDYKYLIIGDKSYVLKPPTIHRLAGACYWLCDCGGGETIKDILQTFANMENTAKALSWFINGDDSLADELAQATPSEVVNGLEQAFSMIDVGNFIKLSVLLKSAKTLIAKQK